MPTRRPASAPDGRTDGRRDPPRGRLFVPIPNSDRVCKNKAAFKPPSPSLSWRAAGPVGASSGRSAPGAKRTAWRGCGRRGPPGQRPGGGRRSAEVPQSASGSLPDFAFAFWRLWITSVLPKTASKIRPKVSPHRIILLVTFRFKLICTTGFAFPLIKKNKGDGGVTGHAFLVWPLDVLCNYKAGKELIVLRRQARNS